MFILFKTNILNVKITHTKWYSKNALFEIQRFGYFQIMILVQLIYNSTI